MGPTVEKPVSRARLLEEGRILVFQGDNFAEMRSWSAWALNRGRMPNLPTRGGRDMFLALTRRCGLLCGVSFGVTNGMLGMVALPYGHRLAMFSHKDIKPERGACGRFSSSSLTLRRYTGCGLTLLDAGDVYRWLIFSRPTNRPEYGLGRMFAEAVRAAEWIHETR